jgi:hypothetical protein
MLTYVYGCYRNQILRWGSFEIAPSEAATEKSDELAPFHWITSSDEWDETECFLRPRCVRRRTLDISRQLQALTLPFI